MYGCAHKSVSVFCSRAGDAGAVLCGKYVSVCESCSGDLCHMTLSSMDMCDASLCTCVGACGGFNAFLLPTDSQLLPGNNFTMECNIPGNFMCGDGKCVPGSYQCNGQPDCFDKSDERGCRECPPPPSHQPQGQLQGLGAGMAEHSISQISPTLIILALCLSPSASNTQAAVIQSLSWPAAAFRIHTHTPVGLPI